MLGAGFLWISLTFLGVGYAHRLKNRILLLEKTKLMINKIKVRTEFLKSSASDILHSLCSAAQLSELDYIEHTFSLIREGEDFPVAWSKALNSTNLDYLTDEKNVLLQLGENFGTSDIKNQVSMLEACEEAFSEFINTAKNKYSKQAKTATFSAMLVGCMLFILLI